MKAQFKINLAAACVLVATSFGATQVNASDEGIQNTIDVRFRYRMESVDQEGFSEDALASILRTRATIKTRWSDKFDSVL